MAGSVSSRDATAGGNGILTLRRRGIFSEGRRGGDSDSRCERSLWPASDAAPGRGGAHVRALVRRPEAAGVARACGADVRIADIFDEASLVAAMEGCEISINLATSLPGPSGRGDYAVNDRVRREGAPIWLKACERAGVTRVIQQSIAMVNAAGDQLAKKRRRWGRSGTRVGGGDRGDDRHGSGGAGLTARLADPARRAVLRAGHGVRR